MVRGGDCREAWAAGKTGRQNVQMIVGHRWWSWRAGWRLPDRCCSVLHCQPSTTVPADVTVKTRRYLLSHPLRSTCCRLLSRPWFLASRRALLLSLTCFASAAAAAAALVVQSTRTAASAWTSFRISGAPFMMCLPSSPPSSRCCQTQTQTRLPTQRQAARPASKPAQQAEWMDGQQASPGSLSAWLAG